MAILRESPDHKVMALCLTNVSREEVMTDFGSFVLLTRQPGPWQMILARNSEVNQQKETGIARLGAYGVLWLLAEKPN